MKQADFGDLTIFDDTEPCPYLSGQTARMPMGMPTMGKVSGSGVDQRLAVGQRRTGDFVYNTACPSCKACEAIRVDIENFQFSKNQKRILSRGDRRFRQEIQSVVGDRERVDLFNRHRSLRQLGRGDDPIDLDGYQWGFVRSCFPTKELSYFQDGRLVMVAICDLGASSMSAVYTYFDPEIPNDSLGTYSILKQIEWSKKLSLLWLYLGYYVGDCRHMNYKSRFRPHERLVDGEWVRFE